MLELLLPVPSGAGARVAIERGLRDAIRDGRLRSGSDLPSSRSLAADLGVARSTVVAAYEQLTAEGYLRSRHGSGTTVADLPTVGASEPDVDLLGPTPRWDFRPGEPDPTSFPRDEWLRSLRHVLDDPTGPGMPYPDPRGHPALRTVLADHLARTRSVLIDPAGLMIVGGFVAGLGFLADTFRSLGIDSIAVEEAMLPMHRSTLRLAGLEVITVPVDEHGIVVDALAASGAGAVLVTPANQYPFAVTMSPERRAALIAWATDRDAWIVEDDYDGEFRYDRRPIGALQGLAPDRVVYGGTASKSLSAGLRLGWLAVPHALRQPLLRAVQLRAGVSAIDQLALADFIGRGRLDRHVRAMRREYDGRRSRLVTALADGVPSLRPAPCEAGLHLHVPVASSAVEQRLVDATERADVGVFGVRGFHRAPDHRAGLVVGFSRIPQHDLGVGIERLVTALAGAMP